MSEIERERMERCKWGIWELYGDRWVIVNGRTTEATALSFAIRRRGLFYRPVCVAPAGVHPDVAYPEAAR